MFSDRNKTSRELLFVCLHGRFSFTTVLFAEEFSFRLYNNDETFFENHQFMCLFILLIIYISKTPKTTCAFNDNFEYFTSDKQPVC